MATNSIYDIEVETLGGAKESIGDRKDQVLLIVNTASKCGFTPQYEGLEKLYKKFKDRGLVVMGFPCNQFGQQEPGSSDDIESFCQVNYGVSFPMYAKVDVNGDSAHPLFQFLKKEKKGVLSTEGIKWNFTKFLVNRQGEVVNRFAPNSTPESLEKDIEKLLG
ncbi:MAG: glutathione peroxidase [bacterium]|nr:glutathione peroxidase [bacterium]